MGFKNLCILVLWTKVASALEELNSNCKHLDLIAPTVLYPVHGQLLTTAHFESSMGHARKLTVTWG